MVLPRLHMSVARVERLLNLIGLLLNTSQPISLQKMRELDAFLAYATTDPRSGERTFERDKAALIELGVPLRWVPPDDEEAGDEGGYAIDKKRYYLPEITLDPAALATLSIAGSAAAAIEGFPMRSAVLRALAKLGFDTEQSLPGPRMVHLPTPSIQDAETLGRHLDCLQEALAQRRWVQLRYAGLVGEPSERKVSPYGIYYRFCAWYMHGYCHTRSAPRTFHLGRIIDVAFARSEALPPHYTVPKDFRLADHAERPAWQFPTGEPQTTVELWVAEHLRAALPTILGARLKLEPCAIDAQKQGHKVMLKVSHKEALIRCIFPYGADLQVLRPLALRETLRTRYLAMAKRYSDANEDESGDLAQGEGSAP